MKNKVRTHVFNGVKYYIGVDEPYWGWCDNPNPTKNEEYPGIRLTEGLAFGSGRIAKRDLIVLIHECLHASNWSKSEDEVDRTSIDIGTLLYRLGFRRQES